MKAIEEHSVEPAWNQPIHAAARYSWTAFAFLILAGIAIRLWMLCLVAHAPLASDSTDYKEMAELLLGGRRFVPYWPPGLSLYLEPILAAGGSDLWLRASMLPWWLLFCAGFVRLARDLRVNQKISLLLLAILSFTPALVHFSIEPMTQMPSAALLLLALSAAFRCASGAGGMEVLLMGGSLGWLSLVRPSALPLLVVLPALVFFRRRQMLRPLLAVALGGVMIFAWIGKVHQLSGQWTINNSNGANLYYGNNPWTPLYRTWYFGSHAKLGSEEIRQFPEYEEIVRRVASLPETERGAEYKRLAEQYVLHRPDMFLLRTVNRVRCFWGFDIFTAANLRGAGGSAARWFLPVFLLDAACYLVVAGFAFYWIAAAPGMFWRRWEVWLLVGAIVLYALPYWISMSHPTYHFPIVAPLVLLGVLARDQAQSHRTGASWRGWAAVAVLALVQVEWVYFLTKS
ncbi:hypothetical protein [Edaphobacter albus]|uniref:hypothetical protein n=1 Tax=Edaphobacter sp. 4G125 TaxID=2763071 RepID=UPI001645CCF2|nr:hypothetical protein [Edaphobacter sp. 4G125]QNI37951.1 hypothetical protein H7846_06710 [Edaphobacter sp. 4G125]